MQVSHTHMSFIITSLIDFLSASNMAGFSRDEARAPREENAVQIPSKKAHLDTTTSALDVVAAGMRGVQGLRDERCAAASDRRVYPQGARCQRRSADAFGAVGGQRGRAAGAD